MSLRYDGEKRLMITLSIVAISLTVGLLLINFAHGQEGNWTQEALTAIDKSTDMNANDTNREINYTDLILNSPLEDSYKIPSVVNKTNIDNLTLQRNQQQERLQSLENMINYCFEHIDSPNPIQDLIDKGFTDPEYRNITCKDIKMTFDINQERITELQNKIDEYWESSEGQQQQAKELESSQKLSCEKINGNWADGKCFKSIP